MTVAAKAAPKTLYQLRNASYLLIGWLGYNKGFTEKSANDSLWSAHRRNTAKQIAAAKEAEIEARRKEYLAKHPLNIPEIVPEGLTDLYKTLAA